MIFKKKYIKNINYNKKNILKHQFTPLVKLDLRRFIINIYIIGLNNKNIKNKKMKKMKKMNYYNNLLKKDYPKIMCWVGKKRKK
jgi:hypothetical protein